MFSWFRSNRTEHYGGPANLETTPLLNPEAGGQTTLQTKTYEKLHTYLLLRALFKGYLPSTVQSCTHLHSLLDTCVLSPSNIQLTPVGRKLVRDIRQLIALVVAVLEKKNAEDQLQDFVWCTRHARLGLDGGGLVEAVAAGGAGAAGDAVNLVTGFGALHTVADLLMANGEFRRLMKDVTIVAWQVLADTAMAGGEVVQTVGKTVKPAGAELKEVNDTQPTKVTEEEELGDSVKLLVGEAGEVLIEGVGQTAEVAVKSAENELKDEGRGYALLERMKMVVFKLRGRGDYLQNVNIISILLKRYAVAYSKSLAAAMEGVEKTIKPNSELDTAVERFWGLITSFGERSEWGALRDAWDKLVLHLSGNHGFEELMDEIGTTVQDILTNPSFLEANNFEEKFKHLRELARNIGTDSAASSDLENLLIHAESTLNSILNDYDIAAIAHTSKSIIHDVFPHSHTLIHTDLMADFAHVLFPLFLQMIQYIPIPRLTVSTPELDLLIENLILEPGDTINATSFSPHGFRISTLNDFELRKGLTRYASSATSLTTIKVSGLTIRANEVGYWFSVHKYLLHLVDEGIISFILDKRGVDVALDVEFGKNTLENLVALRNVKVKIHKLDYKLAQSKFRWIAWLFKPVIRPVLRRVIRKQMEAQIEEMARFINRELVFARERLRATRVAEPRGLWRFVKAVCARWVSAPSEDLEVGIGVRCGKGESAVFEGRYTPGSISRALEEGEIAGEVVERGGGGGWRNEIFNRRF